jgi:hypothetical protein
MHPSKLFVTVDDNKSINDEKVVNISLNGSVLSDISYNSKNYPPKDTIFLTSPIKGKKEESNKPNILN